MLVDLEEDGIGGRPSAGPVIVAVDPSVWFCWEATVDIVPEVSIRFRELIEGFEVCPLNEVLFDAGSEFSGVLSSCAGLFDVPTPTTSRKRLTSPLMPCCTRSPAVALCSVAGTVPGGGAKSLKVVRASDWLAEVWILSRVFASCSFSVVEATDIELIESRRFRTSVGEPIDPDAGEADTCLEGPLAIIWVRKAASHQR